MGRGEGVKSNEPLCDKMEHSTPPPTHYDPAGTTSSNPAMTTLWQRGLQWCRKSKPKLEAPVVVRVDSPRASGRPLANTHSPAAASSAQHAAPSEAGLLVAMQVLSSPDELPRILGVVYEREGLRALPRLAPVCSLWRDTLGDVVRRCGGLSVPAPGTVASFGVMAPTYPLALADGTVAVGDVGPLRTRGETRCLDTYAMPQPCQVTGYAYRPGAQGSLPRSATTVRAPYAYEVRLPQQLRLSLS